MGKEYYVSKENGYFVLRQIRFRDRFRKGKEHPHDLMGGFVKTKKELREMFSFIDFEKKVEGY